MDDSKVILKKFGKILFVQAIVYILGYILFPIMPYMGDFNIFLDLVVIIGLPLVTMYSVSGNVLYWAVTWALLYKVFMTYNLYAESYSGGSWFIILSFETVAYLGFLFFVFLQIAMLIIVWIFKGLRFIWKGGEEKEEIEEHNEEEKISKLD